jgi:hypothetical protein
MKLRMRLAVVLLRSYAVAGVCAVPLTVPSLVNYRSSRPHRVAEIISKKGKA